MLKILNKIFKVSLVSKVKATRIETILVYTMTKRKGSQAPGNAIFASEMMIVTKVIDTL